MWSVEWMSLFSRRNTGNVPVPSLSQLFREVSLFRQDTQFRLQMLDRHMEKIMSVISDFAAKMKVFTDRQDAAVTNLIADVKTLNDKIAELQNSGGTVSPEDQALLDEIQTHGSAIADKLDALDAQTPPAPPAA